MSRFVLKLLKLVNRVSSCLARSAKRTPEKDVNTQISFKYKSSFFRRRRRRRRRHRRRRRRRRRQHCFGQNISSLWLDYFASQKGKYHFLILLRSPKLFDNFLWCARIPRI